MKFSLCFDVYKIWVETTALFINFQLIYGLLYPLFSLEKKGIFNFVSKLVRRQSVPFLVNVSPPKPLDVAT